MKDYEFGTSMSAIKTFKRCRKAYSFHKATAHAQDESTLQMRLFNAALRDISLLRNIFDAGTPDVQQGIETTYAVYAALSAVNSPLVSLPHDNVLSYSDAVGTIALDLPGDGLNGAVIKYMTPLVVSIENELHVHDIRITNHAESTPHAQMYYILDDDVSYRWAFTEMYYGCKVAKYTLHFVNYRPFDEITMLAHGRISKKKSAYIDMTAYRELARQTGEYVRYVPYITEHTKRMNHRMYQQLPVTRSQAQLKRFMAGLVATIHDMDNPSYYRTVSKTCLGCEYINQCVMAYL